MVEWAATMWQSLQPFQHLLATQTATIRGELE